MKKTIIKLLSAGPVQTMELVKILGTWEKYYKWETEFLRQREFETFAEFLYRVRNLETARCLFSLSYDCCGDLKARVKKERKEACMNLVVDSINSFIPN